MSARQRCDVVGHRELYSNQMRGSVELELKLRCGNTTTRSVHAYADGPAVPRYVLCAGPHTNAQLVAQAQINFARGAK